MPTPEEIKPLLPLALKGIADLMDTTDERLPAGVRGLLERFGEACFAYGVAAAHEATTVPAPPEALQIGDTLLTFPPPPGKHGPSKPLQPETFATPTRPPPRRSSRSAKTTQSLKAVDPKIPPPPRLPTDYKKK